MPQYQAVVSNTGGSTPRELFEDLAEELEKQVSTIYLLFFDLGFARLLLVCFFCKVCINVETVDNAFTLLFSPNDLLFLSFLFSPLISGQGGLSAFFSLALSRKTWH